MSDEAAVADDGARARRAVSAIAPLALLVSLTGAVLGIAAPNEGASPMLVAGLLLMAVGMAAGIGCLWHGARNEHERGRWFAVAAILISFTVGPNVVFDPKFFPVRVR